MEGGSCYRRTQIKVFRRLNDVKRHGYHWWEYQGYPCKKKCNKRVAVCLMGPAQLNSHLGCLIGNIAVKGIAFIVSRKDSRRHDILNVQRTNDMENQSSTKNKFARCSEVLKVSLP